MKKNIIYRIVIILIPVLTLLIAIPLIYGWYVNIIRTGKIDGSTKNVSISYELKNGEDSTSNTFFYTIDNLVFFDVDSQDETSYFNLMAFDLEIKLTNVTNSDMTYKIIFDCSKTEVTENETVVSRSYVACYYKQITSEQTIAALKTNGIVSGHTITYTDTTSSYTATCQGASESLKASNDGNTDEASLHLYLIGVQEIDTAINTDFLYTELAGVRTLTNYTFTITIEGTPKSDSTVSESNS